MGILDNTNYYLIKKNNSYFVKNFLNGKIFELPYEGVELFKYAINFDDFKVIAKEYNLKFNERISEDMIKSFLNNLNKKEIIKNEEKNQVYHIQWHLTNKCNLRCIHCYQEDYKEDLYEPLRFKKEIVDLYFEFIRNNNFIPEISLTGGEPILYPYLLDLLDYINEKYKNCRVFILTNGTILNDRLINSLKKYNITGIQISIDGPDSQTHDKIRGKGNFNKAINTIKNLKDNNFYTSIHCVIQKSNYLSIEEYVKLASNLEIDRLTFSRYIPFGNGSNNNLELLSADEISKIYKKIIDLKKIYPRANINLDRDLWMIYDDKYGSTCPVGENTLTILNDGTVLPCRSMPIRIGNLYEENFEEIIFKSKILDKMRINTISECNDCKLIDKCLGGCQGLAFSVYGKIMEYADPQCWIANSSGKRIVDNLSKKKFDIKYNCENGYFVYPEEITNYENLLEY